MTGHATPTTITFEEAGIPVPANFVTVDQIGDMAFTGLGVFDASNLYGHIDLSVSSPNAALFGPLDTLTAQLTNGGLFDFVSAAFGSTHGARFALQGLRQHAIVYSVNVDSPRLVPQQTRFDWTDIDELSIQSSYYFTGYNVSTI